MKKPSGLVSRAVFRFGSRYFCDTNEKSSEAISKRVFEQAEARAWLLAPSSLLVVIRTHLERKFR